MADRVGGAVGPASICPRGGLGVAALAGHSTVRPCGVQAPDSGAAWSEGGANDRGWRPRSERCSAIDSELREEPRRWPRVAYMVGKETRSAPVLPAGLARSTSVKKRLNTRSEEH